MNSRVDVIAGVGLGDAPRKSRWPARLDLVQSGTGLVLALFMWGHMFFVSSILVSRDAMRTITKFFEATSSSAAPTGYRLGRCRRGDRAPRCARGLAVRKFPINYRQFSTFRGHMKMMRHEDTTLWFWQVFTGFALFFLATVHLYVMLTRPDRIGPFESADRVWSDHYWPLHSSLVGCRASRRNRPVSACRQMGLAFLWTIECDAAPAEALKWSITAFFLVLGFATLAAYIKIGVEHAPRYGEAYVPAAVQPGAQAPRDRAP
jgi:fumarate reductase subunit C